MYYHDEILSARFCNEHSSEIEPSLHTIRPFGEVSEGGKTPPFHKQQPCSNCKSITA